MTFDYTLTTAQQRNEWLHQNIHQINQSNAEKCADYLLHPLGLSPKTNPKREDQTINDIEHNLIEIAPAKGRNTYKLTPPPINWDHPDLTQLRQAVDALKSKIPHYSGRTQWLLKRWLRDLQSDARARLTTATFPVHATFTTTPSIDLETCGLDWTNSWHLRQICRYYSSLRQSDSNFDMDYFDTLVEITPLKPWQKHILIRYIDGTNAIIVARELAQNYDHPVQPGYTSIVIRQICRQIAETATRLSQLKDTTIERRKCTRCGEVLPHTDLFFSKGRNYCKKCGGSINGKM